MVLGIVSEGEVVIGEVNVRSAPFFFRNISLFPGDAVFASTTVTVRQRAIVCDLLDGAVIPIHLHLGSPTADVELIHLFTGQGELQITQLQHAEAVLDLEVDVTHFTAPF